MSIRGYSSRGPANPITQNLDVLLAGTDYAGSSFNTDPIPDDPAEILRQLLIESRKLNAVYLPGRIMIQQRDSLTAFTAGGTGHIGDVVRSVEPVHRIIIQCFTGTVDFNLGEVSSTSAPPAIPNLRIPSTYPTAFTLQWPGMPIDFTIVNSDTANTATYSVLVMSCVG